MTAALVLDRLARRLGGRMVIDDLSLAMEAGECLVLAGESGSGKTSLLRLIGGLDRADRGAISIGGTLVEDGGGRFVPPERRGLGMVFQDFALWPHLSVLENVALAVPDRRVRVPTARRLLARMGVAACAARLPATLSGGQQQRVGIARALAAAPKLLLLDEPFSSLDLETRETLRAELRTLITETGLTALCVSHDPADCSRLGDRIAVLEGGRISQCAAPQAMFEAPASPYAARLAGLLGGVVAPVAADGMAARVTLADTTIRVANGAALLGPAERVRLFWPVGAIAPDAAGVPAECRAVHFDAGAWRALYRVAGVSGLLAVVDRARPAVGPARLRIDPTRLRLFPVGDDAPADDARDETA
jgi:iron(III) transport system ATP-binding protein